MTKVSAVRTLVGGNSPETFFETVVSRWVLLAAYPLFDRGIALGSISQTDAGRSPSLRR
jgi:hypothetical protein